MVDWQSRLESGAKRILRRALTADETRRFSAYLDLLSKWQRAHRLVGSTDPTWVVEHLFLDSLLFLDVLAEAKRDLLDLGAGAGFPGIPMKIVTPHMRLTLLEARQRRVSFLRAAVRELELLEVTVLGERAEAVVNQLEGRFSAVVMRCAGEPGKLMPLAQRFVERQGVIVVAGPPTPGPLQTGTWITVEGAGGTPRRFAVYRKE